MRQSMRGVRQDIAEIKATPKKKKAKPTRAQARRNVGRFQDAEDADAEDEDGDGDSGDDDVPEVLKHNGFKVSRIFRSV